WRSPQRSLILSGLLLILGGYGLAYCVRTDGGPLWMLRVQRYHLFPQLGLSLFVAAGLRPWLRSWDASPVGRLSVAIVLALFLLVVHWPAMSIRQRFYRFPEQRRTIVALEHLAAICHREGITREQALTALDPVRTRWFPVDLNAL